MAQIEGSFLLPGHVKRQNAFSFSTNDKIFVNEYHLQLDTHIPIIMKSVTNRETKLTLIGIQLTSMRECELNSVPSPAKRK